MCSIIDKYLSIKFSESIFCLLFPMHSFMNKYTIVSIFCPTCSSNVNTTVCFLQIYMLLAKDK